MATLIRLSKTASVQGSEQSGAGRAQGPAFSEKGRICIGFLLLFGVLFLLPRCSAQTSRLMPAEVGVRVENVDEGQEAAASGVQVGDYIAEWSRGESGGAIESPFDWAEVLIEQAPRGPVTLKGWRRGQQMTWLLGQRRWGLVVTPIFPERLAKTFDWCRDLERAKKQKDVALCWESLGRQIQPGDPRWLPHFVLNQLAESLTNQQRWAEADLAYQRAVDKSREAGQLDVAKALEEWSQAKRGRGDLESAIQHCSEALRIRQSAVPESLAVAKTLSDCGDIERESDKLDKAEKSYVNALEIRHRLAAGSLAEADALGNLAFLAWARGDLSKSEEYNNRALAMRQELAPNSESTAGSLLLLGIIDSRRGDLVTAEKYLTQAHDIYERVSPGSFNVSATVNNMGLVALTRGDLAKAEEYLRQALAVQQKLSPDGLDVASKFGNLAIVAERRGDLAMAENYEGRALAIRRKHGSGPGMAQSLSVLGEIALDRGDYLLAETHLRDAVEILEEVLPNSEALSGALHDLGRAAKESGNFVKAEGYYLKALDIQQRLAPSGEMVAGTLGELGALARAKGDVPKANAYLVRSLAIIERVAPNSQDHANVLHELALLRRSGGDTESADRYMAASLDAVEHQVLELGGGSTAQTEFSARQAYYYRDYLGTLLDRGQYNRAFAVLERSRARLLLTMLAQRDLVVDKDLPSEIVRMRKANENAYNETQEELSKLNSDKDGGRIESLLSRLHELSTEREQLIDSIRKASPRFADLKYPRPLDVNAVRDILDAGTILVSFSVCEDRTALFVVRPTGVEPGLSVFTLPVGERTLKAQVQELRKLILARRTAKDSLLMARARELYDELFGSAEAVLSGGDRLLVVPDGPLQLLPFQALLRDSGEYLVEWKPVSTVVSATVFAELKRARRDEAKPVELVAFGDPHYPRQGRGVSQSTVDVEVQSSVERGLSLSPLPFSRKEVENVIALYPNRSKTYLGEEATEERAKSLGKDVRYIHFAVHGLLDQRFPLNSALVMSIPDKPTVGKDNGLLQAWEIFEQMRLDADLVTLSACNSGLGEELSGEGLLGLTRAFQYAGARSILSSFWSVDDLRTMELMTEFYSQLQAGATKEKALQAAQLKLLHSRAASSPYYWAGFTLVGDWR
jgi:CHAT domain-containing protein/Flp pilus assembly protein TadD